MRATERLSIAGPWLLTVGLFVAVLLTGAVSSTGDSVLDLPTLAFLAVASSWGLVQATIGALIAIRRPENRIGRLLQLGGPLIVSVFLGYVVASIRTTLAGPGDLIGGIAGWWASTWLYLAIYLAFPFVGIFYPDGRLPGPAWRLPVLVVTVAELASSVLFSVASGSLGPGLPDNPIALVALPAEVRDAAEFVGPLGLVLAMAFAVVAIAVRWGRHRGVERSQLKWLFAALVVAGILFPLTFASSANDSAPGLLTDLGIGSALLIPISIGIAILRYRLYEIDRIISRTIAYAAVTGVLVGTFAGAILLFQAVLAPLAGENTVSVAASTLVVAALFQPLRRRVQGVVDRRFNRARYDAERTAGEFAARLRDQVDLGPLRIDLMAVVNASVQPATSGVWLRDAGGHGS